MALCFYELFHFTFDALLFNAAQRATICCEKWLVYAAHSVVQHTAHSTQCGALQSLSLLLTKRTQWFSAVKLSLVGLTTALVQCSKEKILMFDHFQSEILYS